MAADVRPRRSMLYMPGSNPRALEKGRSLPADALILDLEDAVAPDAKEAARAEIVNALGRGGYAPREVLVRINGLETRWGRADLAAMATAGADAVLLPKVESADQVRAASIALADAGAPEGLAIWCMIETPLGVLKVEEIAAADARLAGLVMGTADLARALHCRHTADRAPFLTSLSRVVLAARAYGLAAIDGVFLDLDDMAGLEAECRQGLDLGFDGKSLFHPKTIETANHVFGPSGAEIEEAWAVIDAFKAAEAEGKGVVVLNGKLVENLHVENARRLLALAEEIERRDG
ncbi:MAG: CoA ester lyase [Marivibrio sp.]|uniref:HpcH/HpaI aldolase/citrate lyase family protein n=1 Tax=Marivibrio sp. TaxID=2039719 RepID=UPI0032EC0BCB